MAKITRKYERYSFLVLSIVFLVVLTQMPFGRAFHALIWFAIAVLGAFALFAVVLKVMKKDPFKDDV